MVVVAQGKIEMLKEKLSSGQHEGTVGQQGTPANFSQQSAATAGVPQGLGEFLQHEELATLTRVT